MSGARRKLSRYPKPGPIGGRLIRKVIAQFRANLPKKSGDQSTSDILIAVSGGSDSLALASLLCRYGRRVAEPRQITLLHVNHGWRGAESDADAAFVRALARQWGVGFRSRRAKGVRSEEEARDFRRAFFENESARRSGAPVLTAHQAEDVAETLLWRIFTGAGRTHGGGIAVRHGVQFRPLLEIRKSELQNYLKEEGLAWREDRTNFEGRLLRSKMRLELMPVVERLFPRAVEHLVKLAALARQGAQEEGGGESLEASRALLQALGLKPRRAHLTLLAEKISLKGRWAGELHLPEGWKLAYEKQSKAARGERWVLERL